MTSPDAVGEGGHYLPRGRELAAIVLFWAVFALLSVTNFFFSFAGDRPPLNFSAIVGGVSGALLWAIATPPIFWMARRFNEDDVSQARRVFVYVVAGLFVAIAIDGAMEVLRHYVLPPPPSRQGFSRGGGRPGWSLGRGRFLNEYVLYAAILSAGIARDYFMRYQRRLRETAALRAQLAEARLTALQNQLNPHFLFNTLNAVAALVDRDPAGVRKMIARLSELLRATLDPTTEPEVPLSRELAFASRYLEILQIRFEGRLHVKVDAPPELGSAMVPRFIFQPIIENAMKHAVSRTSAESRIEVTARRDGYDLVLVVSDTGPGEDSNQSHTGEMAVGPGIGLQNTRARLAQLYDDEYQLELTANEAGGTTVTIRLPFHERAV
jgi:signal transduction histidine kinase